MNLGKRLRKLLKKSDYGEIIEDSLLTYLIHLPSHQRTSLKSNKRENQVSLEQVKPQKLEVCCLTCKKYVVSLKATT